MPIVSRSEILILVPTNGRPHCLKDCLLSIHENTIIKCEVVVLDSTSADDSDPVRHEYNNLYNQYSDVCVLSKYKNIPPGKARKILYEYVNLNKPYCRYVLFLDDDVYVYPNSIESMQNTVDAGKSDIVSGIWEENPTRRPVGFVYSFGENNKEKYVLKISARWKNISDGDLLYLDEVMPSLFATIDIFNKVAFDDRYDFYYDIYDFFMECHRKKIKIAVNGSARFFHNPKKYKTISTRQIHDIEIDRNRFIEKWGMTPVILSTEEKMTIKLFILKIIYKFLKPK